MVKISSLAVALLVAACAFRTTRARDATLHYHPTLDELRASPGADAVVVAPPPAGGAAVRVDGFAAAYPQPIGLDYDSAGAFRKVTAIEWSSGELEQALAARLRAAFDRGEAAATHLGGGVINLAVYRFGGVVYGRALLEVRLVRGGSEVYAARYQASAHGPDRAALLAAVAIGLSNQVSGDVGLRTAAAGGAP